MGHTCVYPESKTLVDIRNSDSKMLCKADYSQSNSNPILLFKDRTPITLADFNKLVQDDHNIKIYKQLEGKRRVKE